jgi:hypothetical protein
MRPGTYDVVLTGPTGSNARLSGGLRVEICRFPDYRLTWSISGSGSGWLHGTVWAEIQGTWNGTALFKGSMGARPDDLPGYVSEGAVTAYRFESYTHITGGVCDSHSEERRVYFNGPFMDALWNEKGALFDILEFAPNGGYSRRVVGVVGNGGAAGPDLYHWQRQFQYEHGSCPGYDQQQEETIPSSPDLAWMGPTMGLTLPMPCDAVTGKCALHTTLHDWSEGPYVAGVEFGDYTVDMTFEPVSAQPNQ